MWLEIENKNQTLCEKDACYFDFEREENKDMYSVDVQMTHEMKTKTCSNKRVCCPFIIG